MISQLLSALVLLAPASSPASPAREAQIQQRYPGATEVIPLSEGGRALVFVKQCVKKFDDSGDSVPHETCVTRALLLDKTLATTDTLEVANSGESTEAGSWSKDYSMLGRAGPIQVHDERVSQDIIAQQQQATGSSELYTLGDDGRFHAFMSEIVGRYCERGGAEELVVRVADGGDPEVLLRALPDGQSLRLAAELNPSVPQLVAWLPPKTPASGHVQQGKKYELRSAAPGTLVWRNAGEERTYRADACPPEKK